MCERCAAAVPPVTRRRILGVAASAAAGFVIAPRALAAPAAQPKPENANVHGPKLVPSAKLVFWVYEEKLSVNEVDAANNAVCNPAVNKASKKQ